MNKKTEKELGELLVSITDLLKGTTDSISGTQDTIGRTIKNQEKLSNLIGRIISLIEFLMRSVSIIFFILGLIVWRLFLWEPLSNFFDGIGEKWSSLSEGYQILILGFIGTIIAGIISYIAGAFLLERIKNILKKE